MGYLVPCQPSENRRGTVAQLPWGVGCLFFASRLGVSGCFHDYLCAECGLESCVFGRESSSRSAFSVTLLGKRAGGATGAADKSREASPGIKDGTSRSVVMEFSWSRLGEGRSTFNHAPGEGIKVQKGRYDGFPAGGGRGSRQSEGKRCGPGFSDVLQRGVR